MAQKARLSQNQLFAAILIELTESLSGSISFERIVDAASQLTKLIERDFGLNDIDKSHHVANYFSYETFSAIQSRGWQILSEEFQIDNLDDSILNPYFLRNRLKYLGVIYD